MGISTSVKNLYYAKKKKKSSAHSFSPFALMIDPSKENWGSAVYFLFLCEKKNEIYRVTGGKFGPYKRPPHTGHSEIRAPAAESGAFRGSVVSQDGPEPHAVGRGVHHQLTMPA